MNQKIGRNDPCSCGSGKKYKNCCLQLKPAKKKITAKWINAPSQQMPNLLERTFGEVIKEEETKEFKPVKTFKTTKVTDSQ
ncbi:preprotein translocase subunit SecA [Candidatus Rubidus massiliensis]|nr:MAG: hypothetical protein BGO10_00425 [Chlamydia sp. 32-24]CDZ81239.1 preprotein translocase subunit SecA [Candidatus Rubidus massiliensis]